MKALAAVILAIVIGIGTFGPTLVWATSGGEHAEAEHGEAAAHGVTPGQISDLGKRALNFVVLVIALVFVLRKPMAKFFKGRQEDIAQTLKDLEAQKAEAEAKYREIEGKLASIETEREALMADYAKEGEEEKKKIIAHAHELAERIKKQAELTISQEINAAKTDLRREIADLSASMAEDLIKKNIDDQDQKRLVEEYLEKVVRN